ncbi:MAG TPA: TonB-dependent receptor [bacterium]|nr:TonB-dependent receptor [bacterium]
MFKRAIHAIVLIVAMLAALGASAHGATGQIVGTILDVRTGEPLIGASVLIEGTSVGAACDIDGRYTIRNAPEGTHTLVVASLGYATKKITQVAVKAGETLSVDVSLAEAVTEMKAIEVTAERARATESSVLIKRRSAVNATDGVSAEMMRKAGDADAGDAVRRMVGVSVVGGRSLVVRGMGGRYSSVSLNGSPMPSPEPEKREVPLDLFPTSLLDEVVASKTYTPDMPATFGGGGVNLSTRDFPTGREISFSASGSYNSATTGNAQLTYDGGEKEFAGLFNLGVDDGSRAMPSELMDPGWGASDSAREAAGEALAAGRQWTPTRTKAPLNRSYNLNIGDVFALGRQTDLGVATSLSYGSSYRASKELYREYRGAGGVKDLELNVERGVTTVLWGGLLNSALRLSPNHRLYFRGLHNRTADDEAHMGYGYDLLTSSSIEDVRLRYSSRRITSGQIGGDHNLQWLLGSIIGWRAVVSGADRDDPAMRSNLYSLDVVDGDTTRTWYQAGYSGAFIDIAFEDRDNQFGLDWTLPFVASGSKLKFGGIFQARTRDFRSSRFRYVTTSGLVSRDGYAEQIFTADQIAGRKNRGFALESGSRGTDVYDVNEHVAAGYAMLELPVGPRVKLMLGGRYEDLVMLMNTGHPDTVGPLNISMHTGDWFPAANLVVTVSDRIYLRAGLSRTVARPEYREIAPFQFQDYVQGRPVQGNPGLRSTYITGYDLRAEMYPGPGEVLAVSLFAKGFDDPIEFTSIDGGRPIITWENADEAKNMGVEFEARKSLGFLSSALSAATIGGNLTIIESQVVYRDSGLYQYEIDRPLTGQSPYTLNFVLGYVTPDGKTDANVILNAFGRRVVGLDNAFAPPYYEQPRQELDVSVARRLWQGVTAKLSVKNLLGADYEEKQRQIGGELAGQDVLVKRREIGRSFSLGFSYSL